MALSFRLTHPIVALLAGLALASAVHADTAQLADNLTPITHSLVGEELGTVQVGPRTYHEVRVKSYDQRSLVFTHRGGLGSARLRDLPPDLQTLLGYNPDLPEPEPVRRSPAPAPAARSSTLTAESLTPLQTFDSLVASFGTTPKVLPRQSLQAEYLRLSLTAKSQGRRPSCAIFAIVSALEFQNARLTGDGRKLSEEYLIWAIRRILGQSVPVSNSPVPTEPPPDDLGYSLPEVVSALRAYGIALNSEMPNRPMGAVSSTPPPAESVITAARARRLVNILALPGRDPAALCTNIIHALNHGYPVPIGLGWPNERAIRGGTLSDQAPMPNVGHAVTIVGYECPNGRLEDSVFVFKNSYGPQWGQAGYGRATWRYLAKNLREAYVLDVSPPPTP